MALSMMGMPSAWDSLFSDAPFLASSGVDPNPTASAGLRRRTALPADVIETPDAFVMYVDCPGCKQDDVDVEVDGNLVRVRCEFKVPPEYAGDESKVKWHRTGRPFGAHQRTLRFPDSCDMSKIDAKMQDGTLCVSIGKHPEAKVHRIQIGGGGALQIGEGGEQRA